MWTFYNHRNLCIGGRYSISINVQIVLNVHVETKINYGNPHLVII